MTYNTFILIRNFVGVGLVGLAGFGVMKGCASATAQRPMASGPEVTRPSQATTRSTSRREPRPNQSNAPVALATASGTSTPDRQPLSALDRKVIGFSKEALSNGTSDGTARKWRIKQDRIVIELRSDTAKGSTTWNRLKVDLDRDKNWDEAWDLKPGKPIKRRIAPADDENYTITYDLQGETWVKRN